MYHAILKIKGNNATYITMSFGKSLEDIKKPRGFFINGDIVWASDIEILEQQKTEYSISQAQRAIKNYAQKYSAIYEEIL